MRSRLPPLLVALAACSVPCSAHAEGPPPGKADAGKADAGKPDAGKPDAGKPDAKPDPKAEAAKAEAAKAAAAKLTELVKHGTETCAGGDVDEGLPALRAAWAQHQDAEIALALAQCEIKATDWPSAAEHLAFALRHKEDPEQRKGIEATFLNVRARVGAVKVTVNVDGADVFVGDRFAGQSPLPGEVYVLPGAGHIFAKKTGYGEIEGTVDVKANGTATLALDLAGQGATVQSHRIPERRSMAPLYALASIGGAGVVAGVALFAASAAAGSAADDLLSSLKRDYASQPYPCTPLRTACTSLYNMRANHDLYANVGTGALGVGGAFVGAAIIYGLWATFSTAPERTSLILVPAASPRGGAIWVRGAF
jgi:hypothetical protein